MIDNIDHLRKNNVEQLYIIVAVTISTFVTIKTMLIYIDIYWAYTPRKISKIIKPNIYLIRHHHIILLMTNVTKIVTLVHDLRSL